MIITRGLGENNLIITRGLGISEVWLTLISESFTVLFKATTFVTGNIRAFITKVKNLTFTSIGE